MRNILARLAPRAALLAIACLLVAAAPASAATKTWTGNAAAVPQIQTLTVAGTWASTETATVTINGKQVVVTLATNVTTANVATAIKEAFMSTEPLDGSASTDAKSNTGGAVYGEFRELTATVSGSVVTLTAVTPGVPVTVSVSETAASGTLTASTTQAATGPHFWDNAKNWDTGSVPANDDTVVFRDSDVSCKYGLPNNSLEVTFNVYQSYTGQIGLPTINRDDKSHPYYEYRQRYVRLDDAGTGTNIAHRFGLGQTGAGSRLINLKHSTLKCSPVVYATGAALDETARALNLCCTANTSTLNILAGSVDFSSQDGSTSAFVTVSQTGGDSRGIQAIHSTGAVLSVLGGKMLVGGTGAIDSVRISGGTTRFENQSGSINAIDILGGLVDYASTGTITNLFMQGGTFDARSDIGGFTITNAIIYAGSKYLDPYRRATYTNPLQLAFEPSGDLQFGGSVNNTINVSVN